MSKKKKNIRPMGPIEIINITTKKRKVINLGDERVIFDEKTGTHQVLPIKKSTYEIDDASKEKK
jgi:hypothetical protein